MVSRISGWVSWMSSAVGCVSMGFFAEGSYTDVSSADGSGVGFGLGSGGGDGEWSGVIGVVGMWSGVRSSNCGGEFYGMSENRLSISWLISSRFSSSTYLTGPLDNGGCGMLAGIKDEVQLATT